MPKRDLFKFLIREFHESALPEAKPRQLRLPETRKTVTLVGSRRSGKTFYFFQLIRDFAGLVPMERIVYLNFEDDRILPLQLSDLNELLEAYFELYPHNKGKELFFFFDEIQNVPGWESFVRRVADKEKAKIFVTGSSSKLLSREIATALRGRTLSFRLFPLSFREFLQFKGIKAEKGFEYSGARFAIKKAFEEYLRFGGFPEVALETPELKQKILSEYYELAIHKDIAERYSVRNTALLKGLSKFLLSNIANIFSINAYHASISKEMPVGKETIMEFLSYLEDANLVFFAKKFDYSMKAQQLNPKKAFCIDNGLRNAVAFAFSADEGKLAENIAFIELLRREKEIYYWKNKGEVDFVVKNKDNSLEAINVTHSNKIEQRELAPLLEFRQKFSKTKKLTVLTKDLQKKENGIEFMPLWKWLLEEGMQR